ncbi:MAG: D-tyrosyl-tRNA(Tyr) deacylase [Saprospiraceae bacterium]|nr:D-tyrosyl-tRNA(Tyr) deacylase [Saprospiraceae bacterium]MBP7699723.1 D-tyrosyl-tRNA(Tyr) deacylase [Saprospiraceae bacterium]
MRVVIQRVSQASVTINSVIKSQIDIGLLILLGIEHEDNTSDADWLCQKIAQLRIFPDATGLMNLSIQDVAGNILVVSQFTLFASTKKGNRPSYIRAARPEFAIPLYEYFVKTLQAAAQCKVLTGDFGADMKVSLINDGPVTICIDSKAKE